MVLGEVLIERWTGPDVSPAGRWRCRRSGRGSPPAVVSSSYLSWFPYVTTLVPPEDSHKNVGIRQPGSLSTLAAVRRQT